MSISNEEMNRQKAAFAKSQRYGVHFICASVLIWIFILIVNLIPMSQYYKNALSLYSSAVLVPIALLFAKMFHIRFSEKENPLNSAGLVFALNQFLYLFIVLLVWLIRPEYMILAYAVVVGAHFLPYSWLYNSVIYRVFAIVIPVGAFVFALSGMRAYIPAFMVACDVIMIVLFLNNSKD